MDSQYEINQYEEEYHKSSSRKFIPTEDKMYSQLVSIPNEGYTQEQVNQIKEKFFNRMEEIEIHKNEKFNLALDKFRQYAKFLWD